MAKEQAQDTKLLLDPQTQAFLDRLHRNVAVRFIQNLNAWVTDHEEIRSIWFTGDEPINLPVKWADDRSNIFFGVNGSTKRRSARQGSINAEIMALNCLYAEFDGKDFTSPTKDEIEVEYHRLLDEFNDNPDPGKQLNEKALWREAEGDAKATKYATNPAHYKALALEQLKKSFVPASAITDSGGGYQAYWLLADTFAIDNEELRDRAKDVQKRWVKFVGGDLNVHDIRRILRLPGTFNHKKRYAPNYPLVTFLECDLELTYNFDDLVRLLDEHVPPEPKAKPNPRGADVDGKRLKELNNRTVVDAFNEDSDMEQLLLDRRWTKGKGSKRLSYPGKEKSNNMWITPEGNAYSHSSNDPLWNDGHAVTPFDVIKIIDCKGNIAEAYEKVKKAMGLWKENKTKPDKKPKIASANSVQPKPQTNGNGAHPPVNNQADQESEPDNDSWDGDQTDDDLAAQEDISEPEEIHGLRAILDRLHEIGLDDSLDDDQRMDKVLRELAPSIGVLSELDHPKVIDALIEDIDIKRAEAKIFIAAAKRHVKEQIRIQKEKALQEKKERKRQALQAKTEARPAPWPYAVKDGQIVFQSVIKGVDDDVEIIDTPVADFYAYITHEFIEEGGSKTYKIKGFARRGDEFNIEIPASTFSDAALLKAKLEEAAGPKDPVYALMAKDLGPAIKLLTLAEIERIRVFKRTGWVSLNPPAVEGDEPDKKDRRFAIPGRHADLFETRFDPELPYRLDPNADLEKGLDALREMILSMTPYQSLPLLTAFLQAPMARLAGWRDERYGVFIKGPSNSFKTSNLKLCMSIFGHGWGHDSVLVKWGEGATSGAIMAMAAKASDLPFLVDNYKPSTSGPHQFTSMIHNFMEGGERKRLQQNSELRNSKPINAYLFSTGEDIPVNDAATIARLLIIDANWKAGVEHLTAAQANQKHLPAIGATWLDWLESEEGDAVIGLLSQSLTDERKKFHNILMGSGKRLTTPERIASSLATNSITFQAICMHPTLGTLFSDYEDQYQEGLRMIAREMAQTGTEASEAERYLNFLRALLDAGQVVLARDSQHHEQLVLAKRQDDIIGWYGKDGSLYLIPSLARAKVNALAGDKIGGISEKAINAQFNKMGVIQSHNKDSLQKSMSFGGKPLKYLHLSAKVLGVEVDDDDDEEDEDQA